MTPEPEWTYRHAEQLRDHWWWRPGWRVGTRFYAWHITVDDQPDFHHLAERYQVELATVDGLDLIPHEWLHLTMQGVGFVEAVSDDALTALLASARTRLAQVGPVTVQFERPVIRPEAVALPPSPVEPIQRLRAVVRSANADARGDDALPEGAEGYQPHISLAYVSADQPAVNVRRAIERVSADPAKLTVSAVSLIEMHRDRRMYEWQTVKAVPLGRSA